MPFHIPTVETSRLTLRAHTLADFSHCCRLWADPQVTRFIGGKPQTAEETWTRFLRYAGHWQTLGFGFWAVEEKQTGQFCGELGFANFKRDFTPSIGDIPELGWALLPAKQNHGYATEALQATLAWAQTHFGPTEIACIIHLDNQPSIHLATKLGFQQQTLTTYKSNPTLIFKRSL